MKPMYTKNKTIEPAHTETPKNNIKSCYSCRETTAIVKKIKKRMGFTGLTEVLKAKEREDMLYYENFLRQAKEQGNEKAKGRILRHLAFIYNLIK